MKLKSVLIAIALLSILTIIAYKVTQPAMEGPVASEQKLLDPDRFDPVTQIQFKNEEDADFLKFKKNTSGVWVLEDFYGVPADLTKLRSLVSQFLEATIIRSVTENPERIERLNIGRQHILFLGVDGQPLWELETGKRGPSGGTFVRLNSIPEVLLADLDLYLNTEKQDWIDKTVLDFDPKDIAEVSLSFTGETTPLILNRETKDALFSSTELGEGQKIKQKEVTRFLNSLINARIIKVNDAADASAIEARAHAQSFYFKRFNGEQYTLDIGRKPTPPSDAEIKGESTVDEETAALETKPEPVFIFYTFSRSTDNPWQASLEQVSLTVPDSLYDQLPETRQVFIETIEAPEPEAPDIEEQEESSNTDAQAG